MAEEKYVEYKALDYDEFEIVRTQIEDALREHYTSQEWQIAFPQGGMNGTELHVTNDNGWGGTHRLTLIDTYPCDVMYMDEGRWSETVTVLLDIIASQVALRPEASPADAPVVGKVERRGDGGIMVVSVPMAPVPPMPVDEDGKTGDPYLDATEEQRKAHSQRKYVSYYGFPDKEYSTAFGNIKEALEEVLNRNYPDKWEYRPEERLDHPEEDDDREEMYEGWEPGDYYTIIHFDEKDDLGEAEEFTLVYDDEAMVAYHEGTLYGDTIEEILAIMKAEWEEGESSGGVVTGGRFFLDDDEDWEEEAEEARLAAEAKKAQ